MYIKHVSECVIVFAEALSPPSLPSLSREISKKFTLNSVIKCETLKSISQMVIRPTKSATKARETTSGDGTAQAQANVKFKRSLREPI